MSEDGDISGRDEDGLRVAEYVLGLLPAAEREQLAARLRSEPALRADLGFWRSRLAALDAEFAETPAPAATWPAIERRLFATAEQPGGLWSSLGLWRGLTAIAAAVAVVAIGVNLLTPRPDPNAFAAQIVAAINASGSNVSMVALYNPATGQFRVTAVSADAMPDNDYELWAIEGAAAPKSMGVIPAKGSMQMTLTPDQVQGFGAGTMLAISVEPKGGSPTGAPTGPVVASGMATPI